MKPFALALLLAVVGPALKAASVQTQQSIELKPGSMVQVSYLQYLPEGYADDGKKRWPVILFLHGAGERGNDLNRVKVHGPPKLVESGKKFPFIIISPQCPRGKVWQSGMLLALMEHVCKE